MAKQTINVGTGPNTGAGDALRDALIKVNENFDEVYADIAALEDGNVITDIKGNVFADDSTLLVDATNGKIVGPYEVSLTGGIFSITSSSGNVTLTNTANDINITVADDVEISAGDNINLYADDVTLEGRNDVEIRTDVDVNNYTFMFTNGGNLQFPDSSVQTGAAISVADLKTLVAASTSFADFQSRIAAL